MPAWVKNHMQWIEAVTKKYLKVRGKTLAEYLHYWLHGSFPLDEGGILILSRAYKVHVAVFFGHSYWTTHIDDDLSQVKVFLLFRGNLEFEDSRRMLSSEHNERRELYKKLEKYYAKLEREQQKQDEEEEEKSEAASEKGSSSEDSESEESQAEETGNIMPEDNDGSTTEDVDLEDLLNNSAMNGSTSSSGSSSSGSSSSGSSSSHSSSSSSVDTGFEEGETPQVSEVEAAAVAEPETSKSTEIAKTNIMPIPQPEKNENSENKDDVKAANKDVVTESQSSDSEPLLSRKRVRYDEDSEEGMGGIKTRGKRVKYDESSDEGMGGVVTNKATRVHKPLSFRKKKKGRVYCDHKKCRKGYGTMRAMQRHKKNNHRGNKRFFCDEDLNNGKKCRKDYPNEQQLEQHIRGKHGDGFIAYCGKRFDWPRQRQDHQVKCSRCEKNMEA